MGLTKITAQITGLSSDKKKYEALFLVDTVAIDCLVPRKELLKLGIKPEGKKVYELVEYEYGFAKIAFMGDKTVTQIIFGPDAADPILGCVALENTGIAVDPSTHSLKKLLAQPLK